MDLSIVLVDDEMIERRAMRKIIEDHFGKDIVAGEASNGRQAIRLAEEIQPDMMLMDVKMPGIDGLKAIQIIRKKSPRIKFIMVSAYDSFEFAKRAMGEGVKEYILKPASKEETIEAILRVCKEIWEERKLDEKQEKTREITKQHFFRQLVNFEMNAETELIKKDLFPNMVSAFFLVIEYENPDLREKLIERMEDWSDHAIIQEKDNKQLTALIMKNRKISKDEILHFARILHLLSDQRKWIGLGFSYENLADFPKSYKEAIVALSQIRQREIGGYGFPLMEPSFISLTTPHIVDALLQRNQTGARHYLETALNRRVNRTELQELFFILKQDLQKLGLELGQVQIKNIDSLTEWEEFFQLCILEIQRSQQSRGYIERAKKYIGDRFHQQITLEEVAEYVQLSPPYFATIFKEETGKTFVDYVTGMRMEKAKELLLTENLSFKEISFAVGYKDPNYFSRVFKKYFLLSPREYQNQILNSGISKTKS